MRGIVIGWLLVSMFMAGVVAAEHDKRCPQDKQISAVETLAMALAWPAISGFVANGGASIPALCDKEPRKGFK